MLRLILGRAGCGKTSHMFSQIAKSVESEYKTVLVVPEQYSHDAERTLCEVCGNSAALYAEVASFSRLCNRVFAETGGLTERTIDKGGSILAMSMALSSLSANLRVYNVGNRGTDFLKSLVEAYEELNTSNTDTDFLASVSQSVGGAFGDKLYDLSMIFSMYESIVKRSGCEINDKISRLAESIADSSVANAKIFIDGFTDFTAQEFAVIKELIRFDADITVCLNTPSIDSSENIFALPAKTARKVLAAAREYKIESEIIHTSSDKDKLPVAIRYIEQNLFNYSAKKFEGDISSIEIAFGDSIYNECSFTAASVIRGIKRGLRYREIAVASPNWGKYSSVAEDVFRKYGIPFNETQRCDLLEKPVMLYMLSALDVVADNWAYNDIFGYIKTGFAGLTLDESDLLENYVLKWNIRGQKLWSREEPWDMNPQGYSSDYSEQNKDDLEQINILRKKIAAPLAKLHNDLTTKETAIEKVRSVYNFFIDTDFPNKLKLKAVDLAEKGNLKLADEYEQMWGLIIRALQQFADIMGEHPISVEEFSRLIKLVLSRYDIGTIPASVDSVGMGELARVRGRDIKCLIIMGATNNDMPMLQGNSGIFSDDEREALNAHGIEITGFGEDRVARELGSIYNSVSLPAEKLILTYPSGGSEKKSYIVARIADILGINEISIGDEVYTEALSPCFEYAVSDDTPEATAALKYFSKIPEWKERADAVKRAANMSKGRLSKLTSEKLYGKNVTVSASRIDKFYSCRYSYFLQYGLRAKPRDSAELDSMQTGLFVHYVLENVAREVENIGGFGNVSESELRSLTTKYVREYANTELGGVDNKTGRFKYLFGRLTDKIWNIIKAMAEELSNSDFKPLDFELEFASEGDLPPVEIETDSGAIYVRGQVDRVDGWIKDDKLYLRVVDYKTGVKEFSLTDIWYGRGLQMLIYLFALQKYGSSKYGKSIVPAGVLYTPARDILISSDKDLDADELARERIKAVQRKGILLNEPSVLEAMEHRDGPSYLPIKIKSDGSFSEDNLVTLEELGQLSKHIDGLLRDMAKEIENGSVAADPYFKSNIDTACTYCNYFEVCHFDDTNGDERRFISNLAKGEVWEKMRDEK